MVAGRIHRILGNSIPDTFSELLNVQNCTVYAFISSKRYSSKLGWTQAESLKIASLWASQRVCTRSIFCALNAQNGAISVRVSSLLSIFFYLSLSAYEKHTPSPSCVLRSASVQAPTTPSGIILSIRSLLANSGVVPAVSRELFVHAFSCSSSAVYSPPRASSPRLERFFMSSVFVRTLHPFCSDE
ncbi:HicA-related protein [Sesbania bispinosa]|nr:HicA-related protein [Sesbania bispinosa]